MNIISLDFLIIPIATIGAWGVIYFTNEKKVVGWYVLYCWLVGAFVGGLFGLTIFPITVGVFFILAFLFSKKLKFQQWLNKS